MNITVTKNQVSINTDYILNDKEYNVNKCYFTFSDEYTDDLVKKAIFVQGTSTIEMSIINNQCQIPAEVLNNGQFELRVYAYEVDGEELLLRYSPSYTTAYVRTGSYIENAESPEVITPTQFEQYMQAMNDGLNEVANVDIDAEQLDNGMSVTITNRYGENKTVYAYDGEKGETGATGATGNGIASFEKTSTSGLVDIYTITFTNGTTSILTVTNGKGITSIIKTSTSNLTDTYTITYNDNTTSTFYVNNGRGIVSIDLTYTEENIDTYTITYNDGTTSTYTVTNSTVTDQKFETLETEVNKYKTLSLLLPKVTGEGSSIELNDTVEGVTIDITPEGNTEQTTYTGKNLFDYTTTEFSDASNVNIETSNNVVTITTTKTVTSNNLFVRTKIPDNMLKNGSTYIISSVNVSGVEKSLQLQLRNKDGSYANKIQNNYVVYDDTYSLYVTGNIFSTTSSASIPAGTTAIIKNIQVEESSTATATDYEPYVGGVPSPNPEYPQDVRVVKGDNTIKINGKNLFDGEIETGGWNFTYGQSLSKAPNNNQLRCSNKILVEPNKEYIFSLNGNAVTQTVRYIFADKDNIVISSVVNNTGEITIPNNCKYLVFHSTELKTVYGLELTNPMIEQNNMATTYEPYQQQIYEINLEDLELCKIGDYQDYIYKENDKWYIHKDIGKVVLDGSEDWRIGNPSNRYNLVINGQTIASIKPLSNYFIGVIANPGISYNAVFLQNIDSSTLRINLYNTSYLSNLSGFKTWLSTHNTTVYYVLATPTTTEITDTTLINQLNNLYSAVANQDKTFIECTSTELNNASLIVKASTYKDISSILNPVMEREE